MAGIGEGYLDLARPILARALAYADDEVNWDEVAAGVKSGAYQLWMGVRSAIVTELVKHPRHTTLLFSFAGGDMAELRAMAPAIEAWGKSKGAKNAGLVGRRGWEKSPITKDGWQATRILMEKEL